MQPALRLLEDLNDAHADWLFSAGAERQVISGTVIIRENEPLGLLDYFNDKFVRKLLNWIHTRLRAGGKAILGNFHPCNTDKVLMDHLLDWKLIHRSEEDMNRLFAASSFGKPCTAIRFEAEGINMFASCAK